MSEGGGARWPTGEAYAKLMEGWNTALREAAGKAGFAESSEKFLKAFVEQQAVRADMVEQWAKAMQELAGTDAFAAASGQLLALYAQQVQALRAASRATAETLQIATTEDLAATSQLVVNVERKLDEAIDQLDTLAGELAASASQAATVSGRLDSIESALRDLVASAAKPPPPAPADAAVSGRLDAIESALRDVAANAATPPSSAPAAAEAAESAPPADPQAKGAATAKRATPAKRPARKRPARKRTAGSRTKPGSK